MTAWQKSLPEPETLQKFTGADWTNWVTEEMRSAYKSGHPFPHIVIDNFLDPTTLRQAVSEFPTPTDPTWKHYNNPLEKKLLCNDLSVIPNSLKAILEALNQPSFLHFLTSLTGIEELKIDPGLHGGGLHCLARGGKLDVHLDYSIHPILKLERRLNLIIFLNQNWQDSYEGKLELWDSKMTRREKEILPIFNRAVIFDTGDGSYHGNPVPVACPESMYRKSLALYYLTDPRPEATERYKARFVKRPEDPEDPELEAFRIKRSDPNQAKSTYENPSPKVPTE